MRARNFLLYVVRSAFLTYFQWPAAENDAPASVCSCSPASRLPSMPILFLVFGFGDFGVSYAATVAGRYTMRGGPRLSVQGEPLVVLTRGP